MLPAIQWRQSGWRNFEVIIIFFFIVSAITSSSYNDSVLIKIMVEIWEHSDVASIKSDGARNTSKTLLKQVELDRLILELQ